MIKVGFWFDAPAEYSGGINYLKNVLHALSLVNDGSIRPIIFFSDGFPCSVVEQFSEYAQVERTAMLRRGSFSWFVNQVFYKVFGSMYLINAKLESHEIDVLSHVWFEYKGKAPFKIVSWIPDFQYLHLPELFPMLDTDVETKRNQAIIAQSDAVILSSQSAFEDFKTITPSEYQNRGRILRFVSQPSVLKSTDFIPIKRLEEKYDFRGQYFFLPNQFWAHKNHMLVLQSVKLLKERGVNVLVICTGTTQDLRVKDTGYVDSIFEFIEVNQLHENIRILGLIDYNDVLSLMNNSLALINPSSFEGWSSSVEEAKSMGKPVFLSNIGVHIEQAPDQGTYFDLNDYERLANILEKSWTKTADYNDIEIEEQDARQLKERTHLFGQTYFDLMKSVATL